MKLGYLFVSSLLILILLNLEFGVCDVATNSTTLGGMCIQRERAALLSFKATLVEYNALLPSWNSRNRDCCSWEAVTCHKITGHVIALDLTQGSKPYEDKLFANTVDYSLLELKHLSYLDLTIIDFDSFKFPAYLGSLKQLHYLNLSHTGFSGVVPQNLGNLSSLRTLDLSGGYDDLKVDDLTWATRLLSLEHLDMSGVDLSFAAHLFEVLNTLHSLHYLSLHHCRLDSRHLPHSCTNSTLLAEFQHLDLSDNFIVGEFPCFLPNMTSLTFLDLSNNIFNLSSATHLLGLKLLTHLNLASSAFTLQDNMVELYSNLLRDKINLKSLDIHESGINGNILGLFKNFSCQKIESLSLSDNNLYGEFPQELGELSYLMDLDLSQNHLNGPIPTSLGKLSALTLLDIASNNFSGELPPSLGYLSNLESIDISFNSLETTLSEAHFAKLSKLVDLDLSFNKMIRFGVGSDWVPPFQLTHLSLRSSEMGGRFLQWLQTQKALKTLDLSNCSIGGIFPAWLQSFTSLTQLFLSNNNISGPISKLSSRNMTILDVSDNMITHLPTNIGHMMPNLEYLILAQNLNNTSIPDSICRIKKLIILDLSRNRFSGYIPDCNWSKFYDLWVSSFSSNELTGVVPNSIGEAPSLMRLRLDGNRLSGQLPSTLKNCNWLDLLDVGGNNLSGILPQWIGKQLVYLRFLRLRNNDFSGPIPHELCRLSGLQVMDLAHNNLKGSIPYCFANFSAMMINRQRTSMSFGLTDELVYPESLNQVMKGMELEYTTNFQHLVNLDISSNHLVGEIPWALANLSGLLGLNLSHNHLGGKIPANIGDMKSLESLDLSNNNLQGVIPYSLSSLSFLSKLNLSNNNFSGQIPGGRQMQVLEDPASIYQGNPLLCGAPLQRKCYEHGIAPDVQNHKDEEDEEDKVDKIWFYGIIIAGFATGFWAVIGGMVVKTKWRLAYFRYIEVSMAKMLGY